MFEYGYIFHYAAAFLTTAIPSLCSGLGQARSGIAAFQAIRVQPAAEQDISGLLIIGNALIETAAIIGVIFGLIMIPALPQTAEIYWINLSELGVLAAIGLTGGVVGYVSSFPVEAACHAVARQPFFSKKILIFTVVMQSIMQTPIILAFVVALLIKTQTHAVMCLSDSLRLIGAGLSIGLGSIGPTIGLGIFLREACTSLGVNRFSYPKVISFSLMSEAMIEASVIFSLLISLFILNTPATHSVESLIQGIGLLAAALCMGLSTIGVGIALGKTASTACHYIGINPDLYTHLSRTSVLAQALIEAQTIYAFIIAIKIVSS